MDEKNPMQQVAGFMPEMQDITRQREMAKLLMQQGQAPLQGQMVGNKYVAASPWEGIANLFSTYKANKLAKEADTKQAQLAELIRKGTAEDMLKYNELMYGAPERTVYGAGQEGPTMNLAPATEANPRAAYEFALQSRFPQVNAYAAEMQKPQKLGAEETLQRFNPTTGKMEIVGQGQGKFHEPLRIDTGTGTQLLDPKTLQPLGFVPKAKGGPESLAATGPLRTSFIGEARPHVEIANAYQKVVSAPSSAAGDISKIFGYMKILDPGSTVREGEFATAQNATGVPGKIANLYNKVISGERLSPAQRAEFDQAAGALVQSQKQQYKGIEEHYTNIAKDAGVNPSHIVRDPYAGLDIKVPKAPVVTPVQTQGTGRYNPLRTPVGANQALGLPSQNDIDAELAKRKP